MTTALSLLSAMQTQATILEHNICPLESNHSEKSYNKLQITGLRCLFYGV